MLHDSITSVGSQLLKLSVHQDFLGIDSIGRLYWALATPRGCSRIVVDASAFLQHGRGLSVSKDSSEKFSSLQHCALSEKDNYKMLGLIKYSSPLMSQPLNALGSSSLWIVYETDSEIEELLGWLKDCDPKEKDPRDSIMLGPKYRPQEFINAHGEGQVEDHGSAYLPRYTQLKINLLDMDAALPRVAVRPSKAQLDIRQAWCAFVKSAGTWQCIWTNKGSIHNRKNGLDPAEAPFAKNPRDRNGLTEGASLNHARLHFSLKPTKKLSAEDFCYWFWTSLNESQIRIQLNHGNNNRDFLGLIGGQLDTNIGFQQKLWNKTNKGEASLASLYNEVTGSSPTEENKINGILQGLPKKALSDR
ncbi:hypothetical protein P8452_21780 [Trifolium repens]|nr:hypothetical protein P8452_21780 [Trifolium repens]